MKMGYKLVLLVLLGPLLLSFLAACGSIDHSKKKEAAVLAAPPPEKPKYIFHQVMEGETLASIAKWYSGNEALWYELREDNPGLEPYKLKKGDVVKVPVAMAVVHTEPPNTSTQTQRPKKAFRTGPGQAPAATADQPPDAPDLFGPK
jgi:hypothetical protein